MKLESVYMAGGGLWAGGIMTAVGSLIGRALDPRPQQDPEEPIMIFPSKGEHIGALAASAVAIVTGIKVASRPGMKAAGIGQMVSGSLSGLAHTALWTTGYVSSPKVMSVAQALMPGYKWPNLPHISRRQGIPLTDEERAEQHFLKYGNRDLPPRGSGLARNIESMR